MVKKNNLRFGYKKNLSSSKTGESVGNAKQTIFYFWPCLTMENVYGATFQSSCSK